jgi:sacsin
MLPLRKPSHYEGFEYVSVEPWTPEKVRREILEDFRSIAADCLLFTEIVSISASSRNRGGIREEWSVNAARESPLLEGSFRYGKLTISQLPATARHNSRTWQIATQAVAIDSLPHDLSSVSKRQPIVGLAASSENNHEHGRGSHRFFSILPLPTSTSLPVHVTASFVLSSDRRNIRFDGYDNLETKYNKWLLSTVVPPLYLFLLANLSCVGDNKRHWPGNTPDDSISQIVTSTFYSTHLKTCKLPVFRSKFHPFPVYPQQAVIYGNEPEAVTKVLELIKPHDIVKPSTLVRPRIIKDAGISAVTPQYVKAQILSDPIKLTSTLNVEEISNVVRFLVQDGVEGVEVNNIVGLKILPLEDGTFGTFMSKSNSTSYYVWKKSYGPLIFPPNRIVNSEFHPKDLKILDVDLNIASLDSTNISALARELLQGGEEMMITTQTLLDWITSFWKAYPRLGMNAADIDLLPLVATMEGGHFVSLSYCRTKPVALSNEDLSSSWLWDLLQQLGILTIRKEHLPRALKAILEGKDYPTFNLNKLLSIMEPSISQVVERILSLDEQARHRFASWLRLKLSTSKPPQNLINVARSLPIWPAACKNQPERLCAASQVLQLPSRLTLEVARFMRVLVSAEPTLKHLNAESILYSDLHSKLDLPRVLGVNDEQIYKALLTAWVNGLPASDTQPLPVPNCNLVVQLSNTLYARDPLFEAAFGPGSPSFVHSRFRDLEVDLHRHGLQRQNNLTMTVFADCARALQNSQDDADKTARAAVVFASYSQDLPLHVGSAQQQLWHNVDDIRFIPRKMNVIRQLDYVQHLPEVVSPNQLVREEFEHIAWTQRAFFNEQPDQRVLLAYPGLGKPTILDVVS